MALEMQNGIKPAPAGMELPTQLQRKLAETAWIRPSIARDTWGRFKDKLMFRQENS